MPQNYALSVVKMGSFMFCICYYNTFFKILPIVSVSMSTHARTHTQGIWLIRSVAFSITLVFGQELGPKSRFLLLLSGTAEPARAMHTEVPPHPCPTLALSPAHTWLSFLCKAGLSWARHIQANRQLSTLGLL